MRFLSFFMFFSAFFSVYAAPVKIQPIVVSDSFQLTASVQPDTLTTDFSASYNGDSSQAQKQIAAVMKKYSAVCTYSEMLISSKESGRVNTDFSCVFKDSASFNAAYEDLGRLSVSNSMNFDIKQQKWSVSEPLSSSKLADMKQQAVRQVLNQAKIYGKTMGTYCRAKDISFDSAEPTQNSFTKRSAQSGGSDFILLLETKFRLTCR